MLSEKVCFCIHIISPAKQKHALLDKITIMFAVIVPLTCLLYVLLRVKLNQVSPSREKQPVELRSTGKECYSEAHPNMQTIALHDLYDLHTKCSLTYCAAQPAEALLQRCGYAVSCDP